MSETLKFKQHITEKQLSEISEKALIGLYRALRPNTNYRNDTLIYYSWSLKNGDGSGFFSGFVKNVDISNMFAFTEEELSWVEFNDNGSVTIELNKLDKDGLVIAFDEDGLCDALWEVVKFKLQEVEENVE